MCVSNDHILGSSDPFRLWRFDLTSIFLYLCSAWARSYSMTLSIYVHPLFRVISFPICANVFWTIVRLSGNDSVVIFRLATTVGLAELLCAKLDCFKMGYLCKKETWERLERVFECSCIIRLVNFLWSSGNEVARFCWRKNMFFFCIPLKSGF